MIKNNVKKSFALFLKSAISSYLVTRTLTCSTTYTLASSTRMTGKMEKSSETISINITKFVFFVTDWPDK